MFQEKEYVSDDLDAAAGTTSGRGADIHLVEVEAEITKDRPVVIYCAYGGQSLLAARELAGRGYDAVNALGGLHYYRGKYYVGCRE